MNVLLLQLKRIGDLILTVPAIAALRKVFPDAQITLAVAYGSRELLPAIPGLDRSLVARGGVTDAAQWIALAAGEIRLLPRLFPHRSLGISHSPFRS